MIIFGSLPIIALLLIILSLWNNKSNHSTFIIDGLLIWGSLIVLVTEILSWFNSITFTTLFSYWFIIIIILSVIVAQKNIKGVIKFEEFKIKNNWMDLFIICGVILALLIIFLTGYLSAPNYWDAMTYHLPRVMHWIQQKSVNHYYSNNTRQLSMPPFGGFVILHLQLLTGGDGLAFLPQWLAMVGSLYTVSQLTRLFTKNRSAIIISITLASSVPTGILQASSVQTDYVVTLWLSIFVYQLLKAIQCKSLQMYHISSVRIGFALGLAILSKATAYIFALPFIVWFATIAIRRYPRKAFVIGTVIGLLAVSINLGHYTRNLRSFGSPFGSDNEFEQSVNSRFGIDITFSNMLRNIGSNLGTNKRISEKLTKKIIEIHEILRLDPHDKDSTWNGVEYSISPLSTYENTVGNSLHIILGFLAIIIHITLQDLRKNNFKLGYLLALVFGFILFSSYLKWTEVHQRLILPIFIIACPYQAFMLDRVLRALSIRIISIGLLVTTIPFLLANTLRPIIPINLTWNQSILSSTRTEEYFNELPELLPIYIEATDIAIQNGCSQIGLVSRLESFEYPLHILFSDNWVKWQIHHINPKKLSNSFSNKYDICIVLELKEISSHQLLGSYSKYGETMYLSDYIKVSSIK